MSKPYHELVKTPELDVVRIVSLQSDQVLLVLEADDPNWKLPGGKIHEGETIFQAVQREIMEELGVEASEDMVVNYVAAPIPHSEHIRHIFLMNAFDQSLVRPTEEVAEAKYFAVDAIPDGKFVEHITSAIRLVTAAK